MKFKLLHRPDSIELASRFGLSDDPLADLCKFDGQPPNLSLLVAWFLDARTPYEKKGLEVLRPQIEERMGGKIVFAAYEWITYSLPGGHYTPDWSFWMDTGQWARVEIKASKMQPGYKDARSKLRAAASLNPWDSFFEFRKQTKAQGGGWELEHIAPDLEWRANLAFAFRAWMGKIAHEEVELDALK